MIKNLNVKSGISIIILMVFSIISIFVIAPSASSPEFHSETIKSLDDKKVTVMELTAATAGIATAISLVPGDSTTPLANQILSLSSYLIIVIGAIFLEKILLTLTGDVTFTFLIPIACLLYGINLFVKNEILKRLAIKLGVFGIVIFIVVPVSVKVSNLIENTYEISINQTIEEVNNTEFSTEEDTSEENKDGWSGFTSKVKESVSNIGDNVSKSIEKGKKMLSKLIDAIAVLIITSCVIPIVVLLSFMWIIKIIFSVNIPIPNIKNRLKEENNKDKN